MHDDPAIKALAALGHIQLASTQCRAQYAEVPKEERKPGPHNVPVWCCLPAGHDGPHKCSYGGTQPPFVMRPERIIEAPPGGDVCAKCRTLWPCKDAAAVIAAFAT